MWKIIFGTVLLTCCSLPGESLRILAVLPINSRSHFNMFESLTRALAAKGHQIDVYSQFPLKKPVPNYKDYSLEGSLPIFQNNMSYSQAISFQFLNIKAVLDAVGHPMCEILNHALFQNLIKNPPRDPPYDLVIVEAFLSNCHLIWGRYLNIPMVAIMTTSLIQWYHESLGTPSVPIFLSESINNQMNFQQRLTSVSVSTVVDMMFRYFISEQDKYIKKYFGSGYPNSIELQKDIDLLLINTHHSIEGIRAYTPLVVQVAGLHIKDDDAQLTQKVQKWLDDSKDGCIYVSFGSMVRIETFPDSSLNALYATFKNIAPVRVLMKIAKPNELPPGLPSNVITQTWLSQEQILKHKNTKLFVTHGGLMGTLESIYFAVPMVAVPIFGDQHLNAKLNVERGIAKVIDFKNITEYGLTSTIKEILYNPIYKKNSEKLSKLFTDRPMKPLDTAIYWIEYVGRYGKHALRSPLVDIPWWQAAYLDIYAFYLLISCITLYILKFLLKKIYNFFRSAHKNNSCSVSAKFKKIQ